MRSPLTLSPLKVSMGYFLFGALWIPATDVALAVAFESQQLPTLVGLFKGWSFIALSSLLIYGLSRLHRQQMSATRTKLETANQRLQVLHRVFRHNIRNDLNVIHGYTELLSERVTEPRAQSHVEIVQQTAERIITISEKLKIVENVDPTLSNGDVVDLVALVEAEVRRLESVSSAVNVTTTLPSHARIEGDDTLQYAIREVLENAVAHTDKAVCELSIAVESAGEETVLAVSDDGPGIPAEELESINSEEETSLIHASSVGLWLVKWMCQLHDGYVQFTTASVEGTTVTFHFQTATRGSLLDAPVARAVSE